MARAAHALSPARPFPPPGPSPKGQPALDLPSVKPYLAQAQVATARESLQASLRLSHSPRSVSPAAKCRCAAGSWGTGSHYVSGFALLPAAVSTPPYTLQCCLPHPALQESGPQARASAIPKLEPTFHCHSVPPGLPEFNPRPRPRPRAASRRSRLRTPQPPAAGEEDHAGHWPALLAPPGYLLVPGHALSSHTSSPSQELVVPLMLGGPPLSKVYSPLTHRPPREKEAPCFPSCLTARTQYHFHTQTCTEMLADGFTASPPPPPLP